LYEYVDNDPWTTLIHSDSRMEWQPGQSCRFREAERQLRLPKCRCNESGTASRGKSVGKSANATAHAKHRSTNHLKECKGSVNAKFPGQFKNTSLSDILKAAKKGDKAAKTAWKLLTNGEYKK